MFLDELHIENFRCFENVHLEPGARLNVIVGDNASGKTSLLEAIFLLGRGRTFRQSPLKQAIRRGSDAFTVRADLASEKNRHHRIGVHRTPSTTQFKCNDNTQTNRFDLIGMLPLQYVDPNIHRLIEEGPKHRRQFMDWGVFHVEQFFFPAWRRYRRALRQRNRALRRRETRSNLVVWDAELVRQGEIVDACRRRHINEIRTLLPSSARRLLGDEEVEITYESGWRGSDGLGAALIAGLEQDYKAGFTQQGPHRADFRVTVAQGRARDWVSRGQQKILTSALAIVQAKLLYETRGIRPVLLFDDLAAELGASYRATLAQEIRSIGGQCFLTFLDFGLVPEALADAQLFHVEHGVVQRSGI